MNRRWLLLLPVLAGLFALAGCAATQYDGAPADDARRDGEVRDFYSELAAYGIWFYDDRYGWVWSPSGVGTDWRPYAFGEWVWTDDGWTWLSDEEWGWATYHYGRWAWRPNRGWCWRPARVWGPAWVAWREYDGWVGWCPLPPDVAWNDGFAGVDWDDLPGTDPTWWNFCGEGDFLGPRVNDRLVPPTEVPRLVRDSRTRGDYTVRGGRVHNGGIDPVRIGERVGRPVPHYRVVEQDERPRRGALQRDRDAVRIYRPRLFDAPESRDPSALPPTRTRGAPRVRPVAPPHTPAVEKPGADKPVGDKPTAEKPRVDKPARPKPGAAIPPEGKRPDRDKEEARQRREPKPKEAAPDSSDAPRQRERGRG